MLVFSKKNMIGILSSSSDANIDYVIAWLQEYQHEYIRINADEIIDGDFFYNVNEQKIILNQKIIPVAEINVLWFRKFGGFSRTNCTYCCCCYCHCCSSTSCILLLLMSLSCLQ